MYVIIPPDHAERGVVPICINDVDERGQPVYHGWIEAVEPIADPLREMTAVITGDVCNVSLISEGAVHSLSARNGKKLGERPSAQVFAAARWRAKNFAAGGSRKRKGKETEFRNFFLDLFHSPPAFEQMVADRDFVERLRQKAQECGRPDLETMIDLYLSESEDEIPTVFNVRPNTQERNTLSQRLFRGIRKLSESL
jgi:hypothetical protein